MTDRTEITWRCVFSEAAEYATINTDLEPLVNKGCDPVFVQAQTECEAAAKFINALLPDHPKAVFVLGRRDPDSLHPFIVCEPVTG